MNIEKNSLAMAGSGSAAPAKAGTPVVRVWRAVQHRPG